jgi:hypothetical protein
MPSSEVKHPTILTTPLTKQPSLWNTAHPQVMGETHHL